MPVFNEADGIVKFLGEIDGVFTDVLVIVVDDRSTDSTRELIESIQCKNVKVTLIHNDRNCGHGPTTLRALREGLARGASAIVALDGDGQASADELHGLLSAFVAQHCDVLEGVRTGRQESLYRVVTSWATRLITRVRARESVPDANTPFRVYEAGALQRLLAVIPTQSMVPNLWITVLSRRMGMRVQSVNVMTRSRLGASEVGSTWGSSRMNLPSRRFVRFCVRATSEWYLRWPRVRHVIGRRTST